MKPVALYLKDPTSEEESLLGVVHTEAAIGNSKEADFFINDIRCNPLHAVIEASDDSKGGTRATVIDLGSRYGTYVEGARIDETKLRVGDEFVVGGNHIVLRDPASSHPPPFQTKKEKKKKKSDRALKTGLLTDRTLLEVSLYWGEQLLEARTFNPGSTLTLGSQKEATFGVTLNDPGLQGLPFTVAHYARYDLTLHLPREVSGLVWIGNDPISIDTVRHQSLHSSKNGIVDIKLRVGDRAEINIGELTLSFGFANPADKIPLGFFKNADKTFTKIFLLLLAMYGIAFFAVTQLEIKEKEVKLDDVPKHLKRVIMDAGIASALKRQRAAIGQLANTPQGGRARSEEGKAKAKSEPKKAVKTKKSVKTKNKKNPKRKKTVANKNSRTKATPTEKVDLDSVFSNTSKKAIQSKVAVVGKKNTGNTAAALAEGGFARGRYGEGAGGGGKSVGIGALSGLETGGGMGSGDYGLSPSKGREIKLPESEEIVILGGLDPDVIRAIIRRYLPQIKHCYEQELATKPNLKGKVGVSFIIGPTGSVLNAKVFESSLKDADTEKCITSKVKGWKFPRPRGGGTVGVKYPFLLMSDTGN